MIEQIAHIYRCPLPELTLERAKKMVPYPYVQGWSWFQGMQGKWTRYVPMGKHTPVGFSFPLGQEAGIHPIGKVHLRGMRYDRTRKYALSISSSVGRRYTDSKPITRPDGTWTFDYHAQRTEQGRTRTTDYNVYLRNCLEDGIPVGVLIHDEDEGEGYRVLGLGFVESYNSRGDTFTIHGPINNDTEKSQLFYALPEGDLTDADRRRIAALTKLKLDNVDERKRMLARTIRRERQDIFRAAVYAAYDGRCAVSGTDVADVLQAAHIDDYRGMKSQIVNNGILLRADLHLLYDANLMGIQPVTYSIMLADDARVEPYESMLRGAKLRLPSDPMLCPDDDLLRLHFEQYEAQNKVA